MKSIPITIDGYSSIRAQLERLLRVERPRLLQQVTNAKTIDSDPVESNELRAALDAHKANEERIAELEDSVARAEVIDPARLSGNTVKFGATVTLLDEDTGQKKALKIVGEMEADVGSGMISCASPIARSLIGQKKGASIEVLTPAGPKSYEIKALRWR
jgi:transcription elongation factor GreA